MTGWKRTHCIRGHEWTPENTRVDARGKRMCWACIRAGKLRRDEQRPAARVPFTALEIRARRNARARERYASDAEWREHRKAQTRVYWANDPSYGERAAAKARASYANDPEHREREKARTRANWRASRLSS